MRITGVFLIALCLGVTVACYNLPQQAQPVSPILMTATLSISDPLLISISPPATEVTTAVPCIIASERTQITPDRNDPYTYRGYQHYGSLYAGSSSVSFGQEMPSYQGEEYSFEGTQAGDVMILWFNKLLCRNSAGFPYDEVLDVLVTPPMQENEIFAARDCKINGRPDAEIIAIAEYDPKSMKPGDVSLGPVKYAWRVNPQSHRIEQITSKGVSCTYWIGQH